MRRRSRMSARNIRRHTLRSTNERASTSLLHHDDDSARYEYNRNAWPSRAMDWTGYESRSDHRCRVAERRLVMLPSRIAANRQIPIHLEWSNDMSEESWECWYARIEIDPRMDRWEAVRLRRSSIESEIVRFGLEWSMRQIRNWIELFDQLHLDWVIEWRMVVLGLAKSTNVLQSSANGYWYLLEYAAVQMKQVSAYRVEDVMMLIVAISG